MYWVKYLEHEKLSVRTVTGISAKIIHGEVKTPKMDEKSII